MLTRSQALEGGANVTCIIKYNLLICHAKSVAWTNRVIFPGFIMYGSYLQSMLKLVP
jgi:hypothetical protein